MSTRRTQWCNWMLLSSVLLLAFGYTDGTDCQKLRNGEFYYYSTPTRGRVEVKRQDSLQIEINPVTGDIVRSKIIWKNNCQYTLYVNAFSLSKLSKMDSLLSVTPGEVVITNITPRYYECKLTLKVFGKTFNKLDTIYIK